MKKDFSITTNNFVYNEKAYAKLNLSFRVISKLSNNYHLIQSIIVFLPDIYDSLSIKLSKQNKVIVKGTFGKNLNEMGGDTLIRKTIKELSNYLSRDIKLKVVLKKQIPLGSGLGGGSADASAIARAVFKIFNIHYKKKEVIEILNKIGSDLPACFYSSNVVVEGTGNRLKQLKKIHFKPWVLIITPSLNVSTKFIFESFKGPFSKKMQSEFNAPNLIEDMNKNKNPLQETVRKEFINYSKLMDSLPKLNNITVPRMTGSGSSIFLLFDKECDAKEYLSAIKNLTKNCWKKISQISL